MQYSQKNTFFGVFNSCNFIKKRLQRRFFLVNIAKFFRTPFFIGHLSWLLL